MAFARAKAQSALYLPISYLVKRICLFKLEGATLSKSIPTICLAPLLTKASKELHPTPPRPITQKRIFCNLTNLSSPSKERERVK